MTDRNISLSQRENYTPSQFTEFLWWLSTAEKELITDCVVDRNRYRIIGFSVLATFVDSAFLYLPLGLFMGLVILCIDRALIKGINKHNKHKLTPLLFRGLLALTIGTFMAQPAVLYMFDKEIRMQASLDNEYRKMQKRSELDSLYANRKNELLTEKAQLQGSLQKKSNEVNKARENFIQEADGSGGTGRIGIRDIALAKRSVYQKADEEYQQLDVTVQPRLAEIDKELQTIEGSIKKEETIFTQLLNDGFLTRTEALGHLIKSNDEVRFRYYLIVGILMLIELMPVIAKSTLPAGTYDEKVFLREEMEKEIALTNITKEKELKELYNSILQEENTEMIREFFALTKENRREKIKNFSKKWKENDHQSLDGYWEKLKRDVLSKQEN